MKRFTVIPTVLAVGLIASIALAASDRIVAPFESLTSSGVSGEVRLNPMSAGTVQVHASIRGLQPNVQYVSLIYTNGSCTTGGSSVQLAQFTANPKGSAQFTTQVNQDLTTIKSISIQLVSDLSVQACASIQ